LVGTKKGITSRVYGGRRVLGKTRPKGNSKGSVTSVSFRKTGRSAQEKEKTDKRKDQRHEGSAEVQFRSEFPRR